MAKQVINHLNFIAQHINYSYQYNDISQDRQVFCKYKHKIIEPTVDDCAHCPYFSGLLHGYGHSCSWEDVVPADTTEWTVNPHDKQKELLRVSKLIDKGYIQKY